MDKPTERILDEKLKILILEREDTLYILRNANINQISTQAKFYEEQLDEIRDLLREVKREKVREGEPLAEIKKWDEEYREMKRQEDEIYNHLVKAMDEYSNEEKREEEHLRSLELEKLKLTAQAATPVVVSQVAANDGNRMVRPPKLIISKFEGTHLDWYRFWGQFEVGIDGTNTPQVIKFSHLKELLPPRIRLLVDGLPLSSEGYERAKNILKTKYGQTSEVVNAHVQKIINLPTVTGTNPNKVFEFYEILVSSVQTLESLGKLQEIKGYVRITLDKLVHLRSQLVQFDDNWKDWEFPELVESLRKWTERNPCLESKQTPQTLSSRREHLFQTRSSNVFVNEEATVLNNNPARGTTTKACVYCDAKDHKTVECTNVTGVSERKSKTSSARLYKQGKVSIL